MVTYLLLQYMVPMNEAIYGIEIGGILYLIKARTPLLRCCFTNWIFLKQKMPIQIT